MIQEKLTRILQYSGFKSRSEINLLKKGGANTAHKRVKLAKEKRKKDA
jgi:hypothetical protein